MYTHTHIYTYTYLYICDIYVYISLSLYTYIYLYRSIKHAYEHDSKVKHSQAHHRNGAGRQCK